MDRERTKAEVITALKTVIDPELHIDVHTLGLIYEIIVDVHGVAITMTLTTPLCPYAAELERAVAEAAASVGKTARVTVTFTPPWVPPEGLREILGI